MSEKEKKKKEFKLRIYKYTLRLVKFLSIMPSKPVIREVVSQLMRSGTSMGANYFEAQSASSKKDYIKFFTYSLKSANETLFWLAILRDSNLLPGGSMSEVQWLLGETKELANIFASSILTMKGKK